MLPPTRRKPTNLSLKRQKSTDTPLELEQQVQILLQPLSLSLLVKL